mgnify:CR=1 FL=1
MSAQPFLILDCYFDEKGAAPNFCALLGDEPRVVVRAVTEELPQDLDAYRGILVSGSKANLPSPEPWMDPLLDLIRGAQRTQKPLLGICFGHQAIAVALGGPLAVRQAPTSELGWEEIRTLAGNPILEGLPERFRCFVSHFDEVTPGTPGLSPLARSERCAIQAYQVAGSPIWGMQFHPEMDPLESETLVRNNLARHTSLQGTPDQVLNGRVDGRHLGRIVMKNFIRLASLTGS